MKTFVFVFRTTLKFLGANLYFLFFLAFCVALFDAIGIGLFFPLLDKDNFIERYGSYEIVSILKDLDANSFSILIMVAIFFIFLVRSIFLFGQGTFQGKLYSKLHQSLKKNFLRKTMDVSYDFFLSRDSGHFINILNDQTRKSIQLFRSFTIFISSLMMSFTYIIISAIYSPKTAFISLFLGILIYFIFKKINFTIKKLSIETSNINSDLTIESIQILKSFKYLISTSKQDTLTNRYLSFVRRLTDVEFKNDKLKSMILAINGLLPIMFFLIFATIQLLFFNEPFNKIFVALALLYRTSNNLLSAQKNWHVVLNNYGYLKTVVQEIELIDKNKEIIGNKKFNAKDAPLIFSFSNVSYKYPNSANYTIKNLSIDIKQKTTVAFVGPSGSGKSTILDMLTGLIKPTLGTLKILGINYKQIDLHEWRSKIGFISQNIYLFNDSIKNNISLWDDSIDSKNLERSIENADAKDFIYKLENKLESKIGDNGSNLSGGEKQRITIARELYKNTELLIFDEATSSLDIEAEIRVKNCIDNFRKKKTIIIVAHKLSTVKNVDEIFVLRSGQIVENGSYEELMANIGYFNELVNKNLIV